LLGASFALGSAAGLALHYALSGLGGAGAATAAAAARAIVGGCLLAYSTTLANQLGALSRLAAAFALAVWDWILDKACDFLWRRRERAACDGAGRCVAVGGHPRKVAPGARRTGRETPPEPPEPPAPPASASHFPRGATLHSPLSAAPPQAVFVYRTGRLFEKMDSQVQAMKLERVARSASAALEARRPSARPPARLQLARPQTPITGKERALERCCPRHTPRASPQATASSLESWFASTSTSVGAGWNATAASAAGAAASSSASLSATWARVDQAVGKAFGASSDWVAQIQREIFNESAKVEEAATPAAIGSGANRSGIEAPVEAPPEVPRPYLASDSGFPFY